MFYNEMSCIIIFLTNSESVVSWYFPSPFFEAVKELHEVIFPISVNRTNPRLIFSGQLVIKKHVNVYQQSKLNYNHQLYFQKTFNLSSHCQQVRTMIGGRL